MYNACMEHFPDSDIIIMAAAVADYTPEEFTDEKIKKSAQDLVIRLKPTTDILAEMGSKKRDDQFLAGFALETENTLANAEKKLKRKNLDLIVANSASEEGVGFGFQTNKVSMITRNLEVTHYELKLKFDVAVDIADKIRDLTA